MYCTATWSLAGQRQPKSWLSATLLTFRSACLSSSKLQCQSPRVGSYIKVCCRCPVLLRDEGPSEFFDCITSGLYSYAPSSQKQRPSVDAGTDSSHHARAFGPLVGSTHFYASTLPTPSKLSSKVPHIWHSHSSQVSLRRTRTSAPPEESRVHSSSASGKRTPSTPVDDVNLA